jgi:hypothetical protein
MKILLIIIVVLCLSFLTTLLFEIEFITKNWVRYSLVLLLILLELAAGFYLIKQIANEQKSNQK